MKAWDRLKSTDDAAELQRVAAEVDAELNHHLDLLAEACRSDGVQKEDLAAIVQVRFGDKAKIHRDCMGQRTRTILMKKRLHQLSTLVLAFAVIVLLFLERQARVDAKVSEARMHTVISEFQERLQESLTDQSHSDSAHSHSAYAKIDDRIQIQGYPESLVGSFAIDLSGALLLPDLGRIVVAGLQIEEIQTLLNERAQKFFIDVDLQAGLFHGPDAGEK